MSLLDKADALITQMDHMNTGTISQQALDQLKNESELLAQKARDLNAVSTQFELYVKYEVAKQSTLQFKETGVRTDMEKFLDTEELYMSNYSPNTPKDAERDKNYLTNIKKFERVITRTTEKFDDAWATVCALPTEIDVDRFPASPLNNKTKHSYSENRLKLDDLSKTRPTTEEQIDTLLARKEKLLEEIRKAKDDLQSTASYPQELQAFLDSIQKGVPVSELTPEMLQLLNKYDAARHLGIYWIQEA